MTEWVSKQVSEWAIEWVSDWVIGSHKCSSCCKAGCELFQFSTSAFSWRQSLHSPSTTMAYSNRKVKIKVEMSERGERTRRLHFQMVRFMFEAGKISNCNRQTEIVPVRVWYVLSNHLIHLAVIFSVKCVNKFCPNPFHASIIGVSWGGTGFLFGPTLVVRLVQNRWKMSASGVIGNMLSYGLKICSSLKIWIYYYSERFLLMMFSRTPQSDQ